MYLYKIVVGARKPQAQQIFLMLCVINENANKTRNFGVLLNYYNVDSALYLLNKPKRRQLTDYMFSMQENRTFCDVCEIYRRSIA